MTTRTGPEFAGVLACLYDAFQKTDDHERVEKLDALTRKWESAEAVVACSGHFSAGKSSLINAWLKCEALPTSPIPTSANVVRISCGPYGARVHRANLETLALEGEDAVLGGALWDVCRDGDTVTAVDMSLPVPLLCDGMTLCDTPGIDSTDPTHALRTRDMLYIADLIVFVTDYNHVLSDMNFTFLREWTGAGKRVVVVVNQIDKHSDWELPFAEFADGVETALSDNGIPVEALYYISVQDRDCPYNQMDALYEALPRLARAGRDASALPSLLHLIEEHRTHRLLAADEMLAELQSLQVSSEEDAAAVVQREAARHAEEQAVVEQVDARVRTFAESLLQIPAQAIIMPYTATEKAVAYIVSLRSDFSMGLFGTRAKIAAERERRLAEFVSEVQRLCVSGIERHMVGVASALSREDGLLAADAANDFACLQGLVTREMIAQSVAPSASLDEAYGYQFAKALEQSIRDAYSRVGARLVDSCKQELLAALAPGGAHDDERDVAICADWLKERAAIASEMTTLAAAVEGVRSAAYVQS